MGEGNRIKVESFVGTFFCELRVIEVIVVALEINYTFFACIVNIALCDTKPVCRVGFISERINDKFFFVGRLL